MHGCRPKGQIKQMDACWEQSQQLKDLVTSVLLDILATDPQVLPQPPGVTDGSLAKPGYPGEIWKSTVSGSYSGANLSPPQLQFAVLPDVLPAGDWDFQYQLLIPYAGTGAPQAAVAWLPNMSAVGDGMIYMPNIPQATTPYPGATGQPMVLTSPLLPININQQRGIVINLAVWGTVGFPTGPFTCNGWARRVR